MNVKTLVYGIYPRSDRLRLDYGRHERGSLSTEKLKDIIKEEKDIFYRLTDEINIVTDPLFNWHDIFRPIALSVNGIKLGPLRRYGETNTFYREPLIEGKGELKIDVFTNQEFEENPPFPIFYGGNRKILPIFPSPVAMYRMSSNESKYSIQDFSENLLEIYGKIADRMGSRKILIFAPQIDKDDVSSMKKICSTHEIILLSPEVIKSEYFDGISFKFDSIVVSRKENLNVAGDHSRIPGLGILDAHNTKIENGGDIEKMLEEVQKEFNFKDLILTHNDYMDFLPRTIADRKVKILQEVN